MTRSANRILDFYASKVWAIQEASLQEMYGIYRAALERRELGAEFDPEAVATKTGKRLDNTRTVEIRDGVAILPVSGPIFRYANLFTQISGATSIDVLAKDFNEALENPRVRSILLEINSPGGEVDGTAEFAQQIFDARNSDKHIVAYVSNLGASAAYWIASSCDEIVAQESASLGSIGVVGTVCVHKEKGHVEFVSSQSPNKRPDPATESGRSQIQEHIDDLADVFISAVARNRGWTADQVIDKGGAGALRVGRKAVSAGLADRLGSLESVITDLSSRSRKVPNRQSENVNANDVLHNNHSGSPANLNSGANEMPETDKPAAENQEADLDRTVAEKVKAFFSDTFGASETNTADANQEAITKAQSEAEAAKAEAASAKQEAANANQRIAQLEKDARATRFESLSKHWLGETSKHIAMLELLATSQEGGEESQAFKDYVSNQKAIAEQSKTADLFKEVGSSQPAEGSVAASVAGQIKALRDADSKLSEQQAFDQVWQGMTPKQRTQYREEDRRSVN